MRINFQKLIVFSLAIVVWSGKAFASSPDLRFGFVGTGGLSFAKKFGLEYFTLEGNYTAGQGQIFSSVNPINDPPMGKKVLREVAKLNVRNDSLGENNSQFQSRFETYSTNLTTWYLMGSFGTKPKFTWYAPNPQKLVAAESTQILETMRREKTKSIAGTVWEIGNEPNVFPAILPEEYAAIVTVYTRLIKAEDANAQIALGSLFMPETAPDLKIKIEEELRIKLQASLTKAGVYNSLVSMGKYNSLANDLKNTLFSRILNQGSKEYLDKVLAALPSDVNPNLLSLHIYPYDDRTPYLQNADFKKIIDSTLGAITNAWQTKNISHLWITEFGNINASLSESEVASQLENLLNIFSANAQIEKWLYYKATGADEQFALVSSGPAPLTRLSMTTDFNPNEADFSCSHLNSIGTLYYLRGTGKVCSDPIPNHAPAIIALLVSKDSLVLGDSILIQVQASDSDGDSLQYYWLRNGKDTLAKAKEFIWKPLSIGQDTLQAQVGDGHGAFAKQNFIVVIKAASIPVRIISSHQIATPFIKPNIIDWHFEARRRILNGREKHRL